MTSDPIAHPSPDGSRKDQSLEAHLENVSELASRFSARLPETGRLIGLCHDLGKSSGACQKHLREQNNQKVDHSTAGAQYLIQIKGKTWQNTELQKAFMIPMTMPILAHHGGLREVGTPFNSKDSPTLYGRLKKDIPDYVTPERLKSQIHASVESSQSELAEAYMKHLSDDLKEASLELRLKYLLSSLVDADWTDTKSYVNGAETSRCSRENREESFKRILDYLDKNSRTEGINRYRSEILGYALQAAGKPPGIFSLTAPTGSGKTRSSLGFAAVHALKYHKERIIYVVPYNTISDQYYEELSSSIGLGMNVVEDTGSFDPGDEEERYRELTSTWDLPIIITSAVQFFETLAAAKTSKLRKLHNIADSVIIFDEVQNIPLPYARYLLKMLRCLVEDYGCTLLMMSATMIGFGMDSQFNPREILPDPLYYSEIFSRSLTEDGPRVIRSNLGTLTQEELVQILTEYESGICIVNRRQTAKELYKILHENVEDPTICFCLTKDQHAVDRIAILEQITEKLKSGERCYIISTSLIEAGVDLSAQCVLREFAGLENHVQAAGRCNRNGEFGYGYFSVFELENTEPPRYLLNRYGETKIIYQTCQDPYCLESIQKYFERLHKSSDTDREKLMDFQKLMNYPEIARRMKLIENDVISVIIPCDDITNEINRLRQHIGTKEDLNKVNRFSVELSKYVLEEYRDFFEEIDESLYSLLDSQYYSSEIGLNLDQEIEYMI